VNIEEEIQVNIYSYDGRLIINDVYQKNGKAEIDLSNYPSGIYIVRINSIENNSKYSSITLVKK